jgi:2-polyprenyl-3-methyl-5-hydroxy-6-metoxy-1,4-benzoquinol methylase
MTIGGAPLIELTNGAASLTNSDGSVDVVTSPVQWSYSAIFPKVASSFDEVLASIEVQVTVGSVGLLPINSHGGSSGDELILRVGDGRRTIDVVLHTRTGDRLCLRNVDSGQSEARVFRYKTWERRPVNIDAAFDRLLPKMLLNPGLPAKSEIANAFGILPTEISALLTSRAVLKLNLDEIFTDDLGRFLLREYKHQCDLLSTYDASKMDVRSGYLGPDYYARYFRQSITRVYHLVTALRRFGVESGSLLEIGSLFGTFSGALQKLGYRVTAVDRYRKFSGALDRYIDDLRSIGVLVIETEVDDENDVIDQLPQYDIVISMAVIEHIPHTPRYFLESLARHVRSGGVIALDTPNIAQYWHRNRLRAGKSIHADIKDQFYASIPFEGHHREYTASEMRWMLEQLGCKDIQCDIFDYNLFQFEELSHDHITSLLAMTIDPSLTDTVLVVGRVQN